MLRFSETEHEDAQFSGVLERFVKEECRKIFLLLLKNIYVWIVLFFLLEHRAVNKWNLPIKSIVGNSISVNCSWQWFECKHLKTHHPSVCTEFWWWWESGANWSLFPALARLSDLEVGWVGSCMVPLSIEICALFKSYLLICLWDYANGVLLMSDLNKLKN